MSGDLAGFIAARADEWEGWAQLARSTTERKGADWYADHGRVFEADGSNIAQTRSANVAPHIAEHDPARAMLAVAAIRVILAEHEHEFGNVLGENQGRPDWGCRRCGEDDRVVFHDGWCVTLRAAGAIWSDHPEYEQGWAA